MVVADIQYFSPH